MSTVTHARLLAEFAHHGQVDKAGKPYIDHPRAVATIVTGYTGCTDVMIMTAWLHDVVEDTPVTLDDLRKFGFPEEVVRAVDSVTRRPKEQYAALIERAAADPVGCLVKLADNAHNSSEERLAVLDPVVAAGLRKRYRKARLVLEAAALAVQR